MDETLQHYDIVVKHLIESATALGIDVRVSNDGNPIIMAFKSQQDLNLYRISGVIKEGELVYYGSAALVSCARIDFAVIPEAYE